MNHKQQGGKSKAFQFPASLLKRILPSQPVLAEERHFSRAKSMPINKLFPNSSPSIEYFIQYKEKLALNIAHQVTRDLLDAPDFAPGDYKLILTPQDGGKTVFLYESLRHNDIIGLKLIKGEHNCEEVRVVEIRYKKKTSVAQKGVELELGAPRMKAMMSADTFADAIAEIDKAKADPEIPAWKKEKLAPMRAALEAELWGREEMFLEACGRLPSNVAKAKAILSKISAETEALEKASRLIVKEGDADEKKMSVKYYVGALSAWPFPQEQALAKAFFEALSIGSQRHLKDMSQAYLTEVLPRVYGVAILEHTAMDSVSLLQSLLRLLHSQTPTSAEQPLKDAIAEFDSKFVQLHGMVMGSSREQADVAAQGANYDPERWFLKLCSTMNSRRKLLNELCELEKIADKLTASKPCRHQAKKIIANMAFNLCRVDAEEIRLIEGFIHDPVVKAEMKNWQSHESRKSQLKQIRPLLEIFAKAGNEEAKRAEECIGKEKAHAEKYSSKEGEDTGRADFKNAKAKIDENIHALILELQGVAPALGGILLEYFRRSKMHVSYKQLEMLSKSPENVLTRLAIAQRLFQLSQNPAKKIEYNELVNRYLDEAAATFALLWSNSGSRKAIFDIMRPIRYVQDKGFDLVGNPEKHFSLGNTHDKLFVDYWTEHMDGRNMLSIAFKGAQHTVDLNYDYIYAAGHAPFDFGESEKNIHVDIFGRRITLSDVIPALSTKGSQAIFRELYHISNHDPRKADEIRRDMSSMNTGNARFLSTLALSRNRHSGCVAKFGGTVVENPPLKMDDSAPNTFAPFFAQRYPDAGISEKEAIEFAHLQVAGRAVGALTANKSHIARAYIKSVLAEKK